MLRLPAALVPYLLLTAALVGVPAARACTVFVLHCKAAGWSPVSGRTDDFMPPAKVGWRIDVVPPGLARGTPPCGTCTPTPFTRKYGYAGLTALNGSVLVDGLNQKVSVEAFYAKQPVLRMPCTRCQPAAHRCAGGRRADIRPLVTHHRMPAMPLHHYYTVFLPPV